MRETDPLTDTEWRVTARITDAIGYDVEVSEPNGPAVRGYITARWADERQPDFDRWLAAHDAEVRDDHERQLAAKEPEWDFGYNLSPGWPGHPSSSNTEQP